jgi:hypothetical protein
MIVLRIINFKFLTNEYGIQKRKSSQATSHKSQLVWLSDKHFEKKALVKVLKPETLTIVLTSLKEMVCFAKGIFGPVKDYRMCLRKNISVSVIKVLFATDVVWK